MGGLGGAIIAPTRAQGRAAGWATGASWGRARCPLEFARRRSLHATRRLYRLRPSPPGCAPAMCAPGVTHLGGARQVVLQGAMVAVATRAGCGRRGGSPPARGSGAGCTTAPAAVHAGCSLCPAPPSFPSPAACAAHPQGCGGATRKRRVQAIARSRRLPPHLPWLLSTRRRSLPALWSPFLFPHSDSVAAWTGQGGSAGPASHATRGQQRGVRRGEAALGKHAAGGWGWASVARDQTARVEADGIRGGWAVHAAGEALP